MFGATFMVLVVVLAQVSGNSWSSCDKSCGGGSQNRQSCMWGTICSTIYRGCNMQPCIAGWGQWQSCTKTCGGGTRYKVEQCSINLINKCPKSYGDCNTQECPEINTCPNGYKHRFNTSSSCCKNTGSVICGVSSPTPTSRRVIGGSTAKSGDWPWAAVIVLKTTEKTHCGGSLIHTKWVLTAAHCKTLLVAPLTYADLYVVLGTISISFPPASSQKSDIEDFKIHEDYGHPKNDIALVKLKTEIKVTSVVKPVCLPSGEIVKQDTACITAGWGISTLKGMLNRVASDTLQHGTIRILPLDSCVEGLKMIKGPEWEHLTESQHMCAGTFSGSVDTCDGDSGGPLVCQRCRSCNWFLAGALSFGAANCVTKGAPSIYMNVNKYENWIKKHTFLSTQNVLVC